ncbi:Nucleoside 2-deoxyribosyltransferase like [Chitinophaga sp. CF118]|uniref:nucleoside 2-deoxyribosyltransferase domain-containing protein n=1 Tax=Chitinophaga sp. CF118 TaxID=1884367 RepID=UPI0008EF8CE4|nr:nucleoside 2-deoxyribosyltransferase domain-containing protein [Chitinophaga sp. CF118]SFD86233.1 Nucleoside 2-deoxyribosyltransferase like [Chitinophaga sp. CF118]
MNVFNPPQRVIAHQRKIIFLAGSIEMGAAKEWQQQAIELFDSLIPEEEKNDYLILNPRRPDWDSSWKQAYEDPQFYQQVKWELSSLQKANYVLVYFDPATKSPVSMLELGAFHHKAIVVCPDGFWRKGNIDIFCEEFLIKQVADLENAVKLIVAD